MTEMVRRFLRQKFGSVGILITLSALALLTVLTLAAGQRGLGPGILALFLLAAGSVSRDAGSGALQMILARPIHRSAYLFGRYLGILLSYAAFILAAVLLTLLLAELFSPMVGPGRGPRVTWDSLALAAGASWMEGALIAAILLFFSTFLPGVADVLAYFLLLLLLHVPEGIGEMLNKPRVSSAVRVVRENVLGSVPWDEVLRGEGVLRAATGRYVLALTVFLTLAAVLFARREFSYGQD